MDHFRRWAGSGLSTHRIRSRPGRWGVVTAGPGSTGQAGLPVRRLRRRRRRRRPRRRRTWLSCSSSPTSTTSPTARWRTASWTSSRATTGCVGPSVTGAYDFGSYSMLATELVGWDAIEQYDELMLANDSGWLVQPLDEVFAKMDCPACDWWGLQATKRTSGCGSSNTSAADRDRASRGALVRRSSNLALPTTSSTSAPTSWSTAAGAAGPRVPPLSDGGHGRVEQAERRHEYEIGMTRWLIQHGHRLRHFVSAALPVPPDLQKWYFRLLDEGYPPAQTLLAQPRTTTGARACRAGRSCQHLHPPSPR